MDRERTKQLISLASAFFDGSDYRVMAASALADRFEVRREEHEGLIEILEELESRGIAVHVEGRGWCSPRREGWVVGSLKVNRKGFGFARPVREDPKGDLFIAPNKLKDGHDGDLVLVKPSKPRRQRSSRGARRSARDRGARENGREGRVIAVLRRSPRVILGIYYLAHGDGGVVEPIGRGGLRDIFIPGGREAGVKDGERVLARCVEGKAVGGLPPGEVIERASPEGTWQADLQLIAAEYGLREEFPAEVREEAEQLATGIPAEEIAARVDVRDRTIITIDPRDAKDFDDAVTVELRDDGTWVLGVLVADVSHYVRPGSALDLEAYRRGTSVYLPGKVFPMLPERLSNRICSLQEGEDRLAKAVWMELSAEAELISYRVERVVMCSRRRFSYHEVQEILDGADPDPGEEPLADMLHHLEELRRLLFRRRHGRGGLDLDLPEQRIFLDDDGEVVDLTAHERLNAHRLIEEFMLLANEAVARVASERHINILRRTHPAPPEDDVETFLKFCRVMVPGIPVGGSGDFQSLVEALSGRREAAVMNLALLRTLTRARYSASQALHFALALDEYCHFTSPIRRYPDLQVHRALDGTLFGIRPTVPRKLELPVLDQMAEHSSATERQAEEAEREMRKLRAISWLQPLEGEVFAGIITAVFDYGFFVRLDDNLVEGMVHISSLRDDYYVLQEAQYALRGRNAGRSFRLGDAVDVRLYRADPVGRTIDFRYQRHRPEGERS